MSKENSVTTFCVKSYERWHHIWVMIFFKLYESYGNPSYFVHAAELESAAVTESIIGQGLRRLMAQQVAFDSYALLLCLKRRPDRWHQSGSRRLSRSGSDCCWQRLDIVSRGLRRRARRRRHHEWTQIGQWLIWSAEG
jgi:hypothetical protein